LIDRSAPAVRAQLARDAILLRGLCGDFAQLVAMAPGAPDENALAEASRAENLSIQCTSARGAVARWSIAAPGSSPPHEGPGAALTVVGDRGQAVLWMPEGDGPWMLVSTIDGDQQAESLESPPVAEEAVARLRRAIDHREPEPGWLDAARAVEVVEVSGDSLRRGRTVRLYNESYTEEGAFKGLMGMVGCGVLTAALLGVLAIAAAEPIAKQLGAPRLAKVLGYWPHVLLAVLVLFLLLQLLKLAMPRKAVGGDEDSKQNA
jgi:hypothetical protein